MSCIGLRASLKQPHTMLLQLGADEFDVIVCGSVACSREACERDDYMSRRGRREGERDECGGKGGRKGANEGEKGG